MSEYIPGVTAPPPKLLDDQDKWGPEDFFVYAKTGRKPTNPAYEEFKRQALEDVGIHDDDEAAAAADDLEDLSPQQLHELAHE